jgi:hypothetical protein
MITILATPQSLERAAQYDAGVGYLQCLSQENLFDGKAISFVAFSILFAAAAITTVALAAIPVISLHIAAPIVLSVIAVGMIGATILYLVDRSFIQEEALRWKPVFENVLNGNYQEAFSGIRENIQAVNEIYYGDFHGFPEATIYENLALYNTEIFQAGFTTTDRYFENLEFFTATLKDLKSQELHYDDIVRPAPYLRVKGNAELAEKLIQEQTEPFQAHQVENFAKMLFSIFTNQLEGLRLKLIEARAQEGAHFQNNRLIDPCYQILIIRLLTFGENLLDPVERDTLEAMIACTTTDEIYEVVQNHLAV